LNSRGFLLFDIDGVIRDVTGSYRLAIQQTVNHFCSWTPELENIDNLKSEGLWNNDWDASYELLRRFVKKEGKSIVLPKRSKLIEVFNGFYFGGNQNENFSKWKGSIQNETLLVNKKFFETLSKQKIIWGFVSGAELASAKFVLENRLSLKKPPLIAMGESPEKPDPSGLIKLASQLAGQTLGTNVPPIGYVGDTVADVLTIKNAEKKLPLQRFISFGVAPPHLHLKEKQSERMIYEKKLIQAGADYILSSTFDVLEKIITW
tara:strand:- start:54863 stop:55648 length:786 start_codon:yes stop_codon:yes gene_type:complete